MYVNLRRLVAAVGLVCLLGVAPTAQEDPVAVSMTILTAELRSGFVRGTMNIAVVNHVASTLVNVKLGLERPSSGSIGSEGVVDIGDVAIDGTGAVVAEFILDPAFLASPDPYLVRVNFREVTGTEVEAHVVVLRPSGGDR
jgi:hypothetical protein